MPSESAAKKSDSTLKILVLVGVFLVISVLVLWYLQQKNPSSNTTNTSQSSQQTATFTSTNMGYSLTYPKDWPVNESSKVNPDGSSYKIIRINGTEEDLPLSGKPNLIIYENSSIDVCKNATDCTTESVTYNGKMATKYTQTATGWTIYKFDNDLLVFAFPNGDEEAIEEVLDSITY